MFVKKVQAFHEANPSPNFFFAGSGTKIMKLVCRPAFCFVT